MAKGGCGAYCHLTYMDQYFDYLEQQRLRGTPVTAVVLENTVNDNGNLSWARLEVITRSFLHVDPALAFVSVSASQFAWVYNYSVTPECELVELTNHYGMPLVSFPRSFRHQYNEHAARNKSHMLHNKVLLQLLL